MPDAAKRYVIIGNGVAGTTAAETIRKLDPSARITLLAAEPYPLYNRVALPRVLRGEIHSRRVFMRSVQQHAVQGIDLRLATRATAVDTWAKTVMLDDGSEVPFDSLLIATGGTARRLAVPGADARGIYPFQTLDDARALLEHVRQARQALVVGGSFIAYELVEALHTRGLHVTWLIRGPRFLWRYLDEEGGELVDRIVRGHGIDVIYGDEVSEVRQKSGSVSGVVTRCGRQISCDLIATGLGLMLNTAFLAGSGIRLGYGVITDAYLRTSARDVYAAGDVAEFYDAFLESHHVLGTWNNARGHGRIAGCNMAGSPRRYVDVPYYTTTLFDTYLAVIGVTGAGVRRSDLDSTSYADFTRRTYHRLFFDRRGRLVGAVLIGDLKPRPLITQLIRSREPVEDRYALLGHVFSPR